MWQKLNDSRMAKVVVSAGATLIAAGATAALTALWGARIVFSLKVGVLEIGPGIGPADGGGESIMTKPRPMTKRQHPTYALSMNLLCKANAVGTNFSKSPQLVTYIIALRTGPGDAKARTACWRGCRADREEIW